MNYIDIVFNHWIWDDPYVKAKRNAAWKELEKLFGDGVDILVHTAGNGPSSNLLWGFDDDELVTIYHTFDLTDEQKKSLADIAVLFVTKKKTKNNEYEGDTSVCFIKLEQSSYYYYPFPKEKTNSKGLR